ncbi:MAG: cytidylyltransferase domain-containing protein [Planctomycetota bacterium]
MSQESPRAPQISPPVTSNLTVAIIPVRGGSRGIPRKNARLLAGKPLLAYAIEAARGAPSIARVVVSTDDAELAEIAHRFGAETIERPIALAADHVGLDAVICDAVATLERTGVWPTRIVTIQATCPLVSTATIERACLLFDESESDTVLTVVDDRHLSWTGENAAAVAAGALVPAYGARVNRQQLPPRLRETGGVVVCSRATLARGSRFGVRVRALEVAKVESIDVDDYFDWWLAEKSLKRRRICFHVLGTPELGLGHVYRALTLADRLIDHELQFVVPQDSALAAALIARRFYPVVAAPAAEVLKTILAGKPDLVINDVLDTDDAFMRPLAAAGPAIINFEDLGAGSHFADVVINELYERHPDAGPGRLFAGAEFCCLRDEFYSVDRCAPRAQVENVLLLFGGTDPAGLTLRSLRALDAIPGSWSLTVVLGLGCRESSEIEKFAAQALHRVEIVRDTRVVSRFMAAADIAITSAGRTVLELAALGVPMVVIAQNERETRHAFARTSPGVVYLGPAATLDPRDLTHTVEQLVSNALLRRKMSEVLTGARVREGIDKVLACIASVLEHRKQKALEHAY